MMSGLRSVLTMALVLGLPACTSIEGGPINSFVSEVGPASPQFVPDSGDDGSTMVGLAFSGGGTRAAAFAHGVMLELDAQVIDLDPYRRTLMDDVRMISGTSGGSIAAAYFGLRGREGLGDFRERFLIKDAEAAMRTRVSPVNIGRILRGGGVNDLNNFPKWLDENVFGGATFAGFKRDDAPIVWITASDIYHGTPFVFTYDTFAALCSDLDKVRIADAVAASAAFPVVFAPIMIKTDGPDCGYRQPDWITRALADPEASLRLSAYARSLVSYSQAAQPAYLRLLDGGLTDNTGTTGFQLERAASTTAHGPLSPEEAVKLRTLIYIAADAGREVSPAWGADVQGPKFSQLVPALSHTAITSSMRDGYDALEMTVAAWKQRLIAYRCGLSQSQVIRYRGTLNGWNCRDIEIIVEHLSFRDADAEGRQELFDIPTRLSLNEEQVDMTIRAGRQAVRNRASIVKAVERTQRRSGVSVGGRALGNAPSNAASNI